MKKSITILLLFSLAFATPKNKLKDCEIKLNAPPLPIRMFVVIDDKLSAVASVIATDNKIIAKAPKTPAFPTTHGCRIYMITPKMVKVVGVNTPANVPKVFLVITLVFIVINNW